MKLIRDLLLLVLVTLSLGILFGQEGFAEDDKKESEAESALVKELEPGVRVYGIVPKFGEIGQTNCFDVCPDGETLAFGAGGSIKFWDIEKQEIVGKIEGVSGNSMRYSGDGLSLLAMGWADGGTVLKIFDAITKELKTTIDPKKSLEKGEGEDGVSVEGFYVQTFAISPDDRLVAMSGQQTTLVFELESGEKVAQIKQARYSQSICFNVDGTKIIDATGEIYDVESGEKNGKLPGSAFGGRYINQMKVNPRYGTLATSEWNQGIQLIDMESKKKIDLEKKEPSQYYYQLEFSGNGKMLAATTYNMGGVNAGTPDTELHIWDAKSGKLKHVVKLPASNIQSLRFAADNEAVYIHQSGQIGVTKVNFDDKDISEKFRWHQTPVFQMGFMPDGDSLYAAPQQGAVMFHDLESGEIKQRGQVSQVMQAAIGDDEKGVMVTTGYNAAQIIKMESGKVKNVNVQSFQRPSVISVLGGFLSRKKNQRNYENFAINSVVVSDDNKTFYLSLRSQSSFRMDQYSLKSGKGVDRKKFKNSKFWEKKDLDPDGTLASPVGQMQWRPKTTTVSSDGKYFGIVNEDRKVMLIDVEDDSLLHEFDKWEVGTWPALYFSHDNSKLIAISNTEVTVFDVESGEELHGLKIVGDGYHNNLALSKSGNRIAGFQSHSKVVVFDLDDGEELFTRKIKDANRSIAISEDGRKLALGKNNCQFEVWDLDVLESE